MIKKRSVNILGHQTSISMEKEFWDALKAIADQKEISINALIANIDDDREGALEERGNLSSAIRVYILKELQKNSTIQTDLE